MLWEDGGIQCERTRGTTGGDSGDGDSGDGDDGGHPPDASKRAQDQFL